MGDWRSRERRRFEEVRGITRDVRERERERGRERERKEGSGVDSRATTVA